VAEVGDPGLESLQGILDLITAIATLIRVALGVVRTRDLLALRLKSRVLRPEAGCQEQRNNACE
jgi:hypothetical protein